MANSEDTVLEKTGLLLRLAEVYLKSGEEDLLAKAEGCILTAEKNCDEKLRYDRNNETALRNKSIVYELAGLAHCLAGDMGRMSEMYYNSKCIRDLIVRKYPSEINRKDLEHIENKIKAFWEESYRVLAKAKQMSQNDLSAVHLPVSYLLEKERMKACSIDTPLFLVGTFLLSDKCLTDQFGNEYAALCPDGGTCGLIKEYSKAMQLPYVRTQSVLRCLKAQWLPLEMKVKNIGAELQIRDGAPNYEHMLILYQIVDSDNDTHFVLYFSLAVLEIKLAEMIASGRLDHTESFGGDGHFQIDLKALTEFTRVLCGDYFETDIGDHGGVSRIMRAVPEELEFFKGESYYVINDILSENYYCIIISNIN